MELVISDGGRSKYFKAENVGDCVCRAICNATGRDYLEVYNKLNDLSKYERTCKSRRKKSSSRNGVRRKTLNRYLESIGWEWHPTMLVGQGCKVHLSEYELPKGTLIVSVSKHITCVKDGIIYDTYDCSRNGQRCVYGYFMKGAN